MKSVYKQSLCSISEMDKYYLFDTPFTHIYIYKYYII